MSVSNEVLQTICVGADLRWISYLSEPSGDGTTMTRLVTSICFDSLLRRLKFGLP